MRSISASFGDICDHIFVTLEVVVTIEYHPFQAEQALYKQKGKHIICLYNILKN